MPPFRAATESNIRALDGLFPGNRLHRFPRAGVCEREVDTPHRTVLVRDAPFLKSTPYREIAAYPRCRCLHIGRCSYLPDGNMFCEMLRHLPDGAS